jgi:hypothetical protein
VANPFKDFTVPLAAGDAVYQEGDVGMMMYVIQSGVVELFREVNGQRISYGALEKGDFFGEMSLLLERQNRTTSAVVLEDASLVEIDATLFDKMIRGNIEIAVRMMRKLSLRLREREMEAGDLPQVQAAAAPQPAAPVPAPPEPVSVSPPPAIAEPSPGAGPSMPAAPVPPPPESVDSPPPVVAIPEVPPAEEIPPAPEPPVVSPRRLQRSAAPPQTLEQLCGKSPGTHAAFSTDDGTVHLPLVSDEAAIGRFDPVTGMRPEVDVSAIDINRSVSRHHARVQRGPKGYNLTEEVGALNGTFVNGTRLVTGESTPIQDGDEIGLGVVRLRFRVLSG